MEENYIELLIATCLFYFAVGIGVGWLASKFLKFALLVFLAVVVVAYWLQAVDIFQLNTFAISIKMRELTDVGHVLIRLPYLFSFLLGAYVWRRYLTHL